MIFILKKPVLAADPVDGTPEGKLVMIDFTEDETSICNTSTSSIEDPFHICELSPLKSKNPHRMPRRNSLERNVSLSLRSLFKRAGSSQVLTVNLATDVDVSAEEPKTETDTQSKTTASSTIEHSSLSTSLRNLFTRTSHSKHADHAERNATPKSRPSLRRKHRSFRSVFSVPRMENSNETPCQARQLNRTHTSMRSIPQQKEIVLNGSRRAVGRKYSSFRSILPTMKEVDEEDEKKEVQWSPPEDSSRRRTLPRPSRSWRNMFPCGGESLEEASSKVSSRSLASQKPSLADFGRHHARRCLLDRSMSTSQLPQRPSNLRGSRPGVYRQASSHCFNTSKRHEIMANMDLNSLMNEYEKIVDPDLAEGMKSPNESITGW